MTTTITSTVTSTTAATNAAAASPAAPPTGAPISTHDASEGQPARIATALFTHLERNWNRADATTYSEAFATDADFVDIRGTHHAGRQAIAAGHQHIFDTIYAGSTVHYELDRAREIAPGCVVAVVAATLDAPHGPLQGINHARFTLVIAETGEGWRINAFQNTLLPPAH